MLVNFFEGIESQIAEEGLEFPLRLYNPLMSFSVNDTLSLLQFERNSNHGKGPFGEGSLWDWWQKKSTSSIR